MIGPADAECSLTIEENTAGYVVPNGSDNLLINHLRRLKDDPAIRSALGQNARRTLELQFDKTIACKRIEALLSTTVHD